MVCTKTEVTVEPEVSLSSLPRPWETGKVEGGNWGKLSFGELSLWRGRGWPPLRQPHQVLQGWQARSLGADTAQLLTRVTSPFCRWGN